MQFISPFISGTSYSLERIMKCVLIPFFVYIVIQMWYIIQFYIEERELKPLQNHQGLRRY